MVAIAWLIRSHHDEIRVQGDWPVSVAEVRVFLPEAHRLVVDSGPRGGLVVHRQGGGVIGHALRTMPGSRKIVGYSGPSDVLVVLDAEDRIRGVAIRHSYDTPSHVEDVKMDYHFMEGWNDRSWEEVAEITDLHRARIYGVSGATRTSEAVAKSVTHRLAAGQGSEVSGVSWSFHWRDAVLVAFVLSGCAFAFWKKKSLQRWRWLYALLTIGVMGFWMGDLVAQSLVVGWTQSRIPWEVTPGLVLFVLAVFLLPWFTRQPVYCQFICPHGNFQRWTMKWLPAKWKKPLPDDAKAILRWVPVVLLGVVVVVSFGELRLDLAGIEPFDAYAFRSAGTATVVVAVVGLLISLFVPMAYCRFGCPTGWLLEFLRRRAGSDRFSFRDWVGLALLALALALNQWDLV